MSNWAINQLQNAPQSYKGMSRVIRKVQRAFNRILQVVVKHLKDRIDIWLGIDEHHGHVIIDKSDEFGLALSRARGYGSRRGKKLEPQFLV